MKKIKWVLGAIAVLLVAAQFIRPGRNISAAVEPDDLIAQLQPPPDVAQMLRGACYDCHGNTTRYPWYANVQPAGWFLANHIREAKHELNFSEFTDHEPRWQYHKLHEMIEHVEENEMPLLSYRLLHGEARLSAEQKAQFITWVKSAREEMAHKYPPEELKERPEKQGQHH